MIITSVPASDLEFSGPIVWPKLTADHACDRFIFRRPEMAYFEAIRRMDERRAKAGMLEADVILIKGRRGVIENKKKRFSGGWVLYNPVNRLDKLEDARSFLRRLRRMLKERMPDEPVLNMNLVLRFVDPDDKHELLSLQDRWL